MAPTHILIRLTVAQAEDRREQILREQDMSADELYARGGRYELDEAGVAALGELDALDWLLSERDESEHGE